MLNLGITSSLLLATTPLDFFQAQTVAALLASSVTVPAEAESFFALDSLRSRARLFSSDGLQAASNSGVGLFFKRSAAQQDRRYLQEKRERLINLVEDWLAKGTLSPSETCRWGLILTELKDKPYIGESQLNSWRGFLSQQKGVFGQNRSKVIKDADRTQSEKERLINRLALCKRRMAGFYPAPDSIQEIERKIRAAEREVRRDNFSSDKARRDAARRAIIEIEEAVEELDSPG